MNPVEPTFLYIGTAKSASTWIYEMLHQHPEVYVPPAKDTHFFSYQYEDGLDSYLSYFKDARNSKAVGEVDHDYMLFPEYAERIQHVLPNVKLICCLRNPVSYLQSMFHYRSSLWTGLAGISFVEYAHEYIKRPKTHLVKPFVPPADFTQRPDKHIEASIEFDHLYLGYRKNLSAYLERFPRENIKMLLYDDLVLNPQEFLKSIYAFVGVDVGFRPKNYSERIIPSWQARSKSLSVLSALVADMLFRLKLNNAKGTLKRSKLLQHLFFKPITNRTAVSSEMKRGILNRWIETNRDLSEIIGKDIPSSWIPEK